MKQNWYVRVVASGHPWSLPTPPGNRREFVCKLYVFIVVKCYPSITQAPSGERFLLCCEILTNARHIGNSCKRVQVIEILAFACHCCTIVHMPASVMRFSRAAASLVNACQCNEIIAYHIWHKISNASVARFLHSCTVIVPVRNHCLMSLVLVASQHVQASL